MIDKEKIHYLQNEWTPLPRFRRSKDVHDLKDGMEFLKREIERQKNMLNNRELHGNQRFEALKQMNRNIRRAQEVYSELVGSHYVEKHDLDGERVLEHVIPQNLLTDAYLENHLEFQQIIAMPMVDLSAGSDQMLKRAGLANTNNNWWHPFRRYEMAGIEPKIYTTSGQQINLNNWTLEDHFRLFSL
jgi:hypothetical protein